MHGVRRAVEHSVPVPLEIEEYSHYGMVGRYTAGAMRLPFFPLRSYVGSEMPEANSRIKWVESPYSDETIAVVPPLNPDVAIIHVQRASSRGDAQLWGLLGAQKEAAFAAERVIIVAEEIVSDAVIRSDPNRTLIPGLIVDAVVHEPFGAHPSYVQGHYDRDNAFYLDWDKTSRDREATESWLTQWVYEIPNRAAYLTKLGVDRLDSLKPGNASAEAVQYGAYS